MLMNGKRPAAKPIVSSRRSPDRARAAPETSRTRSAAAIGPPLQRMFMIADPTPICFVRAKMRCASCRMSVFSPISPTKCGITAPGFIF